MKSTKNIIFGLGIMLVILAASSCGPSPEELAATSAAQTAAAATDTPVPTPTATPTPTPAEFLGAVGEWESTDPGDGSRQTLAVKQTATNMFSIVFIDEGASMCGVDDQGTASIAAQGEGEGNSTSNILSVDLVFTCAGDTDLVLGTYPSTFEYNIETDSLKNNMNNWTRIP